MERWQTVSRLWEENKVSRQQAVICLFGQLDYYGKSNCPNSNGKTIMAGCLCVLRIRTNLGQPICCVLARPTMNSL